MEAVEIRLEETAGVTRERLQELEVQLRPERDRMIAALTEGYEDVRASLSCPTDVAMLERVEQVADRVRGLHPSYLVVVGIGGSNLGTMAVHEAVKGRFPHQLGRSPRVLWADTVDSDMMEAILRVIEPALAAGEHVVVNAISKSGTTTETVANFQVLVDVLQRYDARYQPYTVVTTNKGSPLWELAQDEHIDALEIPLQVGGRFSVFSPVGLFPLSLLGVNLPVLREGARVMRIRCLEAAMEKNPAAAGAAAAYAHYRDGKNIHTLFLFGNDLESVGKWHRQLVAESLGKQHDRSGAEVFTGMTPTVAIGSTDLHSVAQLYLGGPFDRFTTFVSVGRPRATVKIPCSSAYRSLVQDIQGRTLAEVMDAINEGVKRAFRKAGRPFAEIVLPDTSEASLGQLLQLKMMEVMYLGALLEVNPFDQPNVESYKEETRALLSQAAGRG